MLDGLLAALKGADAFEAVHGVSEAGARRLLAQQWQHLDSLAQEDPDGYARNLESMAREAGAALPSGMLKRVRASAGGSLFHCQVGFDVMMRSRRTFVTQPKRNHTDIDPRLKQVHGCRVSNRVRRYMPISQLNLDFSGCGHCQCQPFRQVVARHCLTITVGHQ